jgi:sugar phosphate isomerase/epimerase
VKLGLSSYSLYRDIRDGRMSVTDAIRWTAAHGGEHFEVVPLGFSLVEQPQLIDDIRRTAEEVGIDVSNYAVGANFLTDNETEYRKVIAETKAHVDIAHRLGVTRMRHDAASRPPESATVLQFEKDLTTLVKACQEIADYAASFGITTSVENHGYHVQAAERVQRLVAEVDRANFRTTLDVGNFMCADEDPVISVKKNIGIASMVHFKDFYLRYVPNDMGEGWFKTAGGNSLRGAITGHGDIDLRAILTVLRASGYDGYISIEFEGIEDCQLGSRLSLQQVRKLLCES